MNSKSAAPDFVLELDRPRRATFNLRAMNALEQHYEETTGQKQLWNAIDWRNIGTREATRILWAALLTDAEDAGEALSYEQVERFTTASALLTSTDQLVRLVEDLVDRAMPVLDDESLLKSLEGIQKKTSSAAAHRHSRTAQIGSSSSPSV